MSKSKIITYKNMLVKKEGNKIFLTCHGTLSLEGKLVRFMTLPWSELKDKALKSEILKILKYEIK